MKEMILIRHRHDFLLLIYTTLHTGWGPKQGQPQFAPSRDRPRGGGGDATLARNHSRGEKPRGGGGGAS